MEPGDEFGAMRTAAAGAPPGSEATLADAGITGRGFPSSIYEAGQIGRENLEAAEAQRGRTGRFFSGLNRDFQTRAAEDLAETRSAFAYPFRQLSAGLSGEPAPPFQTNQAAPEDIARENASRFGVPRAAPEQDLAREDARFAEQSARAAVPGVPGGPTASQQALTSAGYQESLRDADENYDRYKRAQAAAKEQLGQPYPGGPVDMTNAARGGSGDEYGDAIEAQQQRINTLRSGGGGWLGLFQSGGAQKQLNILRQQQLERGRLGVEQGRLRFDTGKYWQGENPLAWGQLGVHQGQLSLEQQKAAPIISREHAMNDLYGQGRVEDLSDATAAFTGNLKPMVIPGIGTATYGGQRYFRGPIKTISTFPTDPKDAAAALKLQQQNPYGMPPPRY